MTPLRSDGAPARGTRTFVAILIPESWTEYLGGVERRLADAAPSGLAWVKPENIHLTVRFLGDLSEDDVRAACAAVRGAAAGRAAPTARLGALGAFPRLDRPRVVWVGLAKGREEVSALAEAVDNGLEAGGFGPPDKPFRPHLTLARVREGAGVARALERAALPEPPPEAVLERLAVMKSDLRPTGARYNVLEELRLLRPGGKPGPEGPPVA